jgi:hypothetical protein
MISRQMLRLILLGALHPTKLNECNAPNKLKKIYF